MKNLIIIMIALICMLSSCSLFFQSNEKYYEFDKSKKNLIIKHRHVAIKINELQYERHLMLPYTPYAQFYDSTWYLKVLIENYEKKGILKESLENYLKRYYSQCFNKKSLISVTSSSIGINCDRLVMADYFQPEWDEMGIRARKLIAIMEYDGVIMDIEISKIFYQDSDAAEFQRILNSIEFVELKQE